ERQLLPGHGVVRLLRTGTAVLNTGRLRSTCPGLVESPAHRRERPATRARLEGPAKRSLPRPKCCPWHTSSSTEVAHGLRLPDTASARGRRAPDPRRKLVPKGGPNHGRDRRGDRGRRGCDGRRGVPG